MYVKNWNIAAARVSIFLLIFFLVYSLMHVYIFLKARAALGFGWSVGAPLLLFAAFLVSSIVLSRILARHDHDNAAHIVAFIGFVWLGFLFFLVCLNLAADITRLVLWPMQRFCLAGNLYAFLGGRGAFFMLAAAALAISAYSSLEAHNIRIENIRIATDKLPPDVEAVRIVQISDLHLGLFLRDGKSRQVAELVNAQKPDILVSTGDLMDGKFEQIKGLPQDIFREIRAPMGKFAVTGNHEYYSGISGALAFTRSAGFTVLQDEAVVAGGAVRIVGMNDPAQNQSRATPKDDRKEVSVLESGAQELFTILLKHRPEVNRGSVGKFDLQLSGHSHQGQIFPFQLVTRLVYSYSGGSYPLPGGAMLHVNRGTGTWGPPMRFLAPPEITVIDIERQK